jgi:N-acetylneuraminic acid mutarotase
MGKTEGMAVGGVGDIIVAVGGYDPLLGDNQFTRLYDIATDTWGFGTPHPGTARCEVAYGELTHGGKLYVVGGRTIGTGNMLTAYDVATDSWTTLTPMPTARAAAGAAVVGNALYVIGGRLGSSPGVGMALKVVERYDIDTDTWNTVAPLPNPRSDMAVVTRGGKIYVFGGASLNTNDDLDLLVDEDPIDGVDNDFDGLIDEDPAVCDDTLVYDPVKDTWTALTPMPQPRYVHMAGKVGNHVYVFGGADANGVVSGANFVYNITKDKWTKDTPMTPGQAVGETGVYSHGGKVYVVGGAQPYMGSSTNFTQVFMP